MTACASPSGFVPLERLLRAPRRDAGDGPPTAPAVHGDAEGDDGAIALAGENEPMEAEPEPDDGGYPERRPATRGECRGMPRPCPFVSCVYHLYLDVNERTGRIKINFPELDPTELEETCALDLADREGLTLEETGRALNLTRERVRQLEARALAALHDDAVLEDLGAAEGPEGWEAAQPGGLEELE